MKKTILLIFSAFFTLLAMSQNQAVVSAAKMNVLYRGIYNPIAVAVPGIPNENVRVNAVNAQIQKIDDVNFNVLPGAESSVMISVSFTNSAGKQIECGTTTFRVLPIPEPSVFFAGKLNGNDLTKEVIINHPVVEVKLDNFLFDLPSYRVTGFTLSVVFGNLRSYNINGNKLTEDAINAIKNLKAGDKFYIESIKAAGPDGMERLIPAITIVLQK